MSLKQQTVLSSNLKHLATSHTIFGGSGKTLSWAVTVATSTAASAAVVMVVVAAGVTDSGICGTVCGTLGAEGVARVLVVVVAAAAVVFSTGTHSDSLARC